MPLKDLGESPEDAPDLRGGDNHSNSGAAASMPEDAPALRGGDDTDNS